MTIARQLHMLDYCAPPEQPGRGGSPLMQKAVLRALHSYGERCFPSLKHLAQRVQCTEQTVRAIIRALEAWSAVRVVACHRDNGSRTTNRYALDFRAISNHQMQVDEEEVEQVDPWDSVTQAQVPLCSERRTIKRPENQREERDAKPSPPLNESKPNETQGVLIPNLTSEPIRKTVPPDPLAETRNIVRENYLDKPAPKPPSAHDVREAFVPRYRVKFGCDPEWGGKQAAFAKKILAQVASACASHKPPSDIRDMLAKVLDAYLADTSDAFVVKRNHAFVALSEKAPGYIRNIVGGGGTMPARNMQGRWQ